MSGNPTPRPPPFPKTSEEPNGFNFVAFRDSVTLETERQSVSVGQTCDSIDAVDLGLVVTKTIHDLNRRSAQTIRVLVPWSNIKSAQYE